MKKNLHPVLMMCEMFTHSVIKEDEARITKQFTRCPFTTNTEVNLPTVLIMCELSINNIIKEIEA